MTVSIESSNSGNIVQSTTATTITASSNNIINLPTPYETSFERIDLVPLKKQLDNVLKDRSEDYWDWIRRFLAGKLSKRELDYYVQTNLTEGNLHLHNQFFKAVIFNAFYSKTPPPPIVEQTKATTGSLLDKKRKQPPSSVKPKKDSKKKKDGVSSSAPSTTTTATASATTISAPNTPSATSGTSLSSSSSSIKTSKKPSKSSTRKSTSKLTLKKKHYPKYSLYASQVQALKEKMETIASENGLEGISKQSIIYMKLALEQHIFNFVNRVKPHIISKNIEPPLQPNQIIPQEYLNNNNSNSSIYNNQNLNNINVNNNNNNDNNKMDINIQETINDSDNSSQTNNIANNNNVDNNKDNIDNNLDNKNINNNNNNNNPNEIKTFKFSDVFNFNKQNQDLKINYPKYVESNNPYLSQPTSFYRIPENIFSSSIQYSTNNCESIITTQDIFTMVEENPYMLIDDPLSLERLNLLRY